VWYHLKCGLQGWQMVSTIPRDVSHNNNNNNNNNNNSLFNPAASVSFQSRRSKEVLFSSLFSYTGFWDNYSVKEQWNQSFLLIFVRNSCIFLNNSNNSNIIIMGGASILALLAGLTLRKQNENKILLSWFSSNLLHALEYNSADEIKCIVSQLQCC
jgi:hypothetical protein